MKHRTTTISVIIILLISIISQVGLAAPGDNNSPNDFYRVELFGLKKRGSCDSTKYTITNIDWTRIDTSHGPPHQHGVAHLVAQKQLMK